MHPKTALLAAMALLAAACTTENTDYCDADEPSCPGGKICNVEAKRCEPTGADGGLDVGPGGDVATDGGADAPLWDLGGQELDLDAKCSGDGDCVQGTYCDPTGGCVQKKANGVDCGGNNECSSNLCAAEGVCCDRACDGDCETCVQKERCELKAPGAACYGTHEAVCSNDFFSLLEPECDGQSADCGQKSASCGAYFCLGKSGGDDLCRTSCTAHSDCQSTICDLHLGLKNQCVPAAQICYVSASGCSTSGADGSQSAPYCTIGECVSRRKSYISVENGTYDEALTLEVDTYLVAPGATRSAPFIPRCFIEPPNGSAVSTGVFDLVLDGFTLNAGLNASNTSTVVAGGSGDIILEHSMVASSRSIGISSSGSLTIRHSLISDNAHDGINSSGTVLIEDSTLIANGLSGSWPAIYVKNGSLKLWRSLVSGNGAGVEVEGALLIDSAKVIDNLRFGLYLDLTGAVVNDKLIRGSLISGNGEEGLRVASGSLIAANVTLVDNAATHQVECTGTIEFHNSIIWQPAYRTAAPYTGSGCSFEHSDVAWVNLGGTNLKAHPAFESGSYALSASSPCRDKGNNEAPGIFINKGGPVLLLLHDLADNPRIANGTIDIGAYEFQP